jgi:geranylgeranylglycerol-phosphate geranylgeranyltransferase
VSRSTFLPWVRLFRPHFIPVSLSAGLVGIVVGSHSATGASIALGVLICASGYGMGQIINDFIDRRADAVNAPDRPMVAGEVNPHAAVVGAVVALAGSIIAAAFIAPPLAIWVLIALGGHLLYAATKGVPLVGNLVNGVDMGLFTVIGAAAAAPHRSWVDQPQDVVLHTALICLVLTAFSVIAYFKDIDGDRAAGYITLPVFLGPRRARWFAVPFSVAPFAIAWVLAIANPGALGADGSNAAFWVLTVGGGAAFVIALADLITEPVAKAYEALLWSTRGMVLFALGLGALIKPGLFIAVAVPMMVFLEVTLRMTAQARQA